MSYKDPSYVIFDGDNDKWAYGYMKGWKQNDRVCARRIAVETHR